MMSVLDSPTEPHMALTMSPGETMKPLSPTSQNPIRFAADASLKSFKSKLPPAVANVPADHIRGYVHTKRVNHYLVGSNLGEGSFAKVKEAFHVLVGEKVAMKVIDKKKALQDPYVAKNFRREAKLLQMVRHPNILQLLEVIETDSSFYLITELCSGGELMKYIYKKGQLEEDEVRKFMRQIVSAVDHMHRAGIIHRDLKVENMLLDASMDIKIIDFGLSNEEFVQGENGLQHCTTQCGSPAYAAPELLGHKAYGPQVDIWSIGVNMYAMLTGCLPYTVEPFNITALHAKMLENKMNPIPEKLSSNCKDLMKKLLRSNPDERLKMPEIMSHPWMNEGHTLPFGPAPFPNKLQLADINKDIVQHMVNILKVKESEDELLQELISNRATQPAAVYYMLAARLARYKKHFQSHPTRVRKSKVSRDQGFYEDEDDDNHSTVSMPASRIRRTSRQTAKAETIVPLRPTRPGAGKERPISHPPLEDEIIGEEEDRNIAARYHHQRRQTMPEMMLKDDLAQFHAMRRRKEMIAAKKEGKRPLTRQNTGDLKHKRLTPPSGTTYGYRTPDVSNPHPEGRHARITPPSSKQFDHSSTHYEGSLPSSSTRYKSYSESDSSTSVTSNPSILAPLNTSYSQNNSPTKHSYPNTPRKGRAISNPPNPALFNEIRDEFASKIDQQGGGGGGGGGVMHAWRSNPPSRNPSRNPSRQGSRQSSSTVRRATSNSVLNRSILQDDDQNDDDLIFHPVQAHTLPKSKKIGSAESINDSTHLPSITEGDTFFSKPMSRRRAVTDASELRKRVGGGRNGYMTGMTALEARTELRVEEVMREIARVANALKIREVEQTSGSCMVCLWDGIKIQITVSKPDYTTCKLSFQWISGGDMSQFREKRDKLFKRLKL